MRRKVSLIMTLAAWLLATGSHWDLVQTFAWGRMIAAYSESMPLTEAIRRTFTAENLCGVCEIVQQARQDQDPATPPAGKLNLKVQLAFPAVPVVVVSAPESNPWHQAAPVALGILPPPPPTPPPRAA